jgi:hypothetical protein
MSICDWLSDRMPSIALGQAEWTPEEARHLNGCPSCQAEWALVQVTRRLGNNAPLVRDPDSMAHAVLHRLQDPPGRSRALLWGFSGLAAAAVAAVIWIGEPAAPAGSKAGPAAVAAGLPMPLPELDALQPAELDSVLTTMDDASASSPAEGDIGLGDLDSEELQRVLDTWEG